jgi:hypothetical protein
MFWLLGVGAGSVAYGLRGERIHQNVVGVTLQLHSLSFSKWTLSECA